LENAQAKPFTHGADGVAEERTTFQRSDAQPAATAKQQPYEGILGRRKTFTENDCDKTACLLG